MSGVLNLLLAGAASAIKDAYYNLTTLLLNTSSTNGAQNNTFLDSSTNNFSITRNGNTTQGTFTPFSQTGWSNFFNGTTDYLSNSALTTFLFTSDLNTMFATFEAWVYPTSWNGNSGYTHTPLWGNNGTYATIGFYNGTLQFTRGNAQIITATDSISLNTWSHVAVTINQSTVTFYINGVNAGTGTLTAALGSRGTDFIGHQAGGGGYSYFAGYISNFRISTNVVYTSNFTPSTTPLTSNANTAVLTCQSNRYIDSANNYTLTANGTPSVQAFSPFAPTAAYSTSVVGGSGYFDGTTDYLSFVDSANDLDLGGRVASIEAWVYPTTAAGTQHFLVKTGGDVSWNTTSGLEYAIAFDVNKFYFVYNVSASATFINGAATRKPNQWYHVVVATDASNNIALFVNGVRDGTATNAISKPTNRTLMYIGANSGGTETLTGYVSGERFIAGTGAYDPTQTTITIPTAPPTNVTNTKLLLNFTNSGIFDSTAKNDLHTVADSQVSTTQAKWGTTSIKLDGTGDWLVVRNGPHLQFGGGNFTIEMWAYFIDSARQQTVISKNDSGHWGQWFIYLTTGGVLSFGASSANTSADVASGSFGTPNFNAWNHIAVVRNGTSFTGYLNGVGTLIATSSLSLYNDPYDLRVGANVASTGLTAEAGTQFNGYMDDIRITKGYARYTANFTPPIAPFPTQ